MRFKILFGTPSLTAMRDREIAETERRLAVCKSLLESYLASTELYTKRLTRLKQEREQATAEVVFIDQK